MATKKYPLLFDIDYWKSRFPCDYNKIFSMGAVEFHIFERQNDLTQQQREDLRRLRRRHQGKRAAKKSRQRKHAKDTATNHNEVADVVPAVVEDDAIKRASAIDAAVKRARAAADAVAANSGDDVVNHILLIAKFLQDEANIRIEIVDESMSSDQDAANLMFYLA